MSASVIAASASVFVAVLAFVLNQVGQARNERRKARLARLDSQLRDLYGPLNTLIGTNERIWEALRDAGLPTQAQRTPEAGTADWRRWRDKALVPINYRMRDLIIEHTDLLIESEIPPVLRDFCAHVASLDIVVAMEQKGLRKRALIGHPGDALAAYIYTSFTALKAEQQRLLRLKSAGPWRP